MEKNSVKKVVICQIVTFFNQLGQYDDEQNMLSTCFVLGWAGHYLPFFYSINYQILHKVTTN